MAGGSLPQRGLTVEPAAPPCRRLGEQGRPIAHVHEWADRGRGEALRDAVRQRQRQLGRRRPHDPFDEPPNPGLVLQEGQPAGGGPHERDRGNSGQPLRGRQPQPDGGAADLDEAADDRLDGGGVRRGVPGERLLIDAELLLDALHALDEVVLLGGTLVECHHDSSYFARGLHPSDRVVTAELRLQALVEPVDLGRVDSAELDVDMAGPRPDPSGAASARVQKATEWVEKVHGPPGDDVGCEDPMSSEVRGHAIARRG